MRKVNIMIKNKQKPEVVASYKFPIELRDGMLLPPSSYPKSVTKWTAIRHGVLINEYMHWYESGKKYDSEFAKFLVKGIENGRYPVLRKTHLDTNLDPFTEAAITSQIGWLKQPENQIIVKEDGCLRCIPNNLLVVTSYQKAGESKKSQERKKLREENQYLLNLAEQVNALSPQQKEKFMGMLK